MAGEYGFSCCHVWMWELDCEESSAPKNWCFWTVVLKKTLESPLDCKGIQPVHSKGDQSWVFFGRNPFQYSYLENPTDREAWWATVHRVATSRIWLKWLSTHSREAKINETILQPFRKVYILSTNICLAPMVPRDCKECSGCIKSGSHSDLV